MFQFLLKEHESSGAAIRRLYLTLERVMAVGIAAVTAAVAYMWSNSNLHPLLVMVPFVLIGLMFFMIFLYAELMELAGYKKQMEHEINYIVGSNVALWESEIVDQLGNNRSGWWISLLIQFGGVYALGILAGSVYFTAAAVWYLYPWYVLVLIGVLLIGSCAFLVRCFLAVFSLRDLTYSLAREAARKRVTNPFFLFKTCDSGQPHSGCQGND